MAKIERVEDCPFYGRVPKDRLENMRFRRFLLEKGYEDRDAAQEIWIMCARDPLFWINTFVWTFEPRAEDAQTETRLPFITWEFQDPTIINLYAAVGIEDRIIDKSRDMAATWMMLLVILHQWLFLKYRTFRMASRVESLVDKRDDLDALLPKLDYVMKWLPSWMKPEMPLGSRTHLHMANLERGNTIEGGSTTSDMFRGGRCTCAMLDEAQMYPDGGFGVFKATGDTANSRFINGTCGDPGNVFDEKVMDPSWASRRIELDWTLHPLKRPGLYEWKNNELILHDKPYWRNQLRLAGRDWTVPDEELAAAVYPHYNFVCDGWLRSPWFDWRESRAGSRMEMEQEVRRNRAASQGAFYPGDLVMRIKMDDCLPPRYVGSLAYDPETLAPVEFIEDPYGPLKLWCELEGGRPVPGRYVMGNDVASVSQERQAGASVSASVIFSGETGEQAAEWADHNLEPQEVARNAIALGRWFSTEGGDNALMVYECNGPGLLFGSVVLEYNYMPLYMRRRAGRIGEPATSVPGFHATGPLKQTAHGRFRMGLREGKCTIRSIDMVNEMPAFRYSAGTVEHAASKQTRDPSGARHNHGDRTSAGVFAWEGTRDGIEIKERRAVSDPAKAKPNCWAYRAKVREEEARRAAEKKRWVNRAG